jgi:uncharacterized repeat protein (TIGR01451 family)
MRNLALVVLLAVGGAAVAQEADVGVELVGPNVAGGGDQVGYLITALNAGPDAADGAEWSLTLPAGLGFAGLVQQGGSGWNCTTPAAGSAGTLTCQLANFAAGDTARFALQFDVDALVGAGTAFDLQASISSATFDLAEENDRGAGALYIGLASADAFVEIDAPTAVRAGGELVYTLRVGNAGPGIADGVTLTKTLPGTLTFVSLQTLSGPAPSCTTPAVGAGGTVTCAWPPLAAGALATLQLVAAVPAGTVSGEEFLAQALVSATSAETSNENDMAAALATASAIDLALTASAPATANAGTQTTYTLSLLNAGPDLASGVVLRTAVPAGSRMQSFTRTAGPAFACLQPAAGGSGNIECSTPLLGNGASATFELTVDIDQAFAHNTPLRLEATASAAEADTDDGNNSATRDVTVANTVDLALTQAGPVSANAGQSATYRLTIANAGPDVARNVVLSSPIPADTRFVSVQQTIGSGFGCTAPAVGASSGTIVCSGAALAAGASVAVDVVLQPSLGVADGGSITTAASVSNDVPDGATGNNSSSLITPVVNRANLQVSVSAPAEVSGGTTMAIDITARNLGGSAAQAVAFASATPTGTTFVSLAQTSGPTFACVAPQLDAAGAVACTLGVFDVDAVAVFRLTVKVPSNQPAGSGISYSGSLVSSTVDPATGNNAATGNSSVVSRVDLQVSLNNGRVRVLPGQDQLYALVAANAGPADATGAALSFQPPAGLANVAWTCVAAQSTASCPAQSTGTGALALALTLPAGTHLRFDLIGTVNAEVGATVVARADIAAAASHSEQNPANNQATDSDPVSMPVLFADSFESPPAPGVTSKAARAVAAP